MGNRDDTYQNRNVSLEVTLRFDHVLDAQKLFDALWNLLERPGWKKLGARLRLDTTSGKLEYHVPEKYTKERPPVNFTQQAYGVKLEEHHIGRQFPAADERNDGVQVFDILESLREITQTKKSTVVLEDWIYTDKAQLGLHIASFKDATLVTLTWLHTFLDAVAQQALLRAWTAVLEERDEDIPEFWGFNVDALARLGAPLDEYNGDAEDVSAVQEEAKSSIWTAIRNLKTWLPRSLDPRTTFAYLYSQFFGPERMHSGRMIYLPAAYMTRLRNEAMRNVTSLDTSHITYNTSESPEPKPFLSDGDVFSAWLTRHLMSCDTALLTSPPTRPVIFVNILDMRTVLSTSTFEHDVLIPRGKAYIANCTTGVISPFGLHQFLSMPLGHTAARIRKDLIEQGSREAVEASQRASRVEQQTPMPRSDAAMIPAVFIFSNWAKAGLFETDFSAAIVHEREDGNGATIGGTGRGKPTYVHVYGNDRRASGLGVGPGGIGTCVGRDARGGYWLGAKSSAGEFVERFGKAVLSDG